MSSIHDERPRVLIVDDEKFIRDILADFLGMEGYVVRTAEDGAAALARARTTRTTTSSSATSRCRGWAASSCSTPSARAAPNALTVIMTGFGTVETAIDAMKRGAYDYILKPFKVEEVIRVVQRGLEKQRLAAENLRLREALSLYKVSEAIAASLSLEEVLATIGDTGAPRDARRPGLDLARRRRGRLLRAAAPRASRVPSGDGAAPRDGRARARDALGRARSSSTSRPMHSLLEQGAKGAPLLRARRPSGRSSRSSPSRCG